MKFQQKMRHKKLTAEVKKFVFSAFLLKYNNTIINQKQGFKFFFTYKTMVMKYRDLFTNLKSQITLALATSGTACSLDIRLYWAVKMMIFLATWADITN
jgi:hypothetical protein